MITEEMRAAGWRECPEHSVVDSFAKGFWTVRTPLGPMLRTTALHTWTIDQINKWPHRPVNSTTWDYSPDGWGDEAIKIKHWPTVGDVEEYGRMWKWHSDNWVGQEWDFVADVRGSSVVLIRNSLVYPDQWFTSGDYFTPARAG